MPHKKLSSKALCPCGRGNPTKRAIRLTRPYRKWLPLAGAAG
jgi:hypothetical protein